MSKLPRQSVLFSLLLFIVFISKAFGMWGIPPELPEYDLIAIGRLGDLKSSVVLHRGALYDQLVGTIEIEKVLYAENDTTLPKQVTLHSCQAQSLSCPRVAHERYAYQRGVWSLRRDKKSGIYTAYTPEAFLGLDKAGSLPPRRRLHKSFLNVEDKLLELEVRYENFSPEPARFSKIAIDEKGRVSGVGNEVFLIVSAFGPLEKRRGFRLPTSTKPTEAIQVPPWRFIHTTTRIPIPPEALEAGVSRFALHAPAHEGHYEEGCWITRRMEESDDQLPIWLEPTELVCALHSSPSLLTLISLVTMSLLVLFTRGQNWRWRRYVEKLAVAVASASLFLAPWCLLGIVGFGPQMLALGPTGILRLVGFEGLLAIVLWSTIKGWKPHARFMVVLGFFLSALWLAFPLMLHSLFIVLGQGL